MRILDRSPRLVIRTCLAGFVLLLPETGCSTAGPDASRGDGVVGTESVVTISPFERQSPVSLVGDTLDGARLDVSSYRGRVVVVNYWSSDCGPCRHEAPALARAEEQLPNARFVGINRSADSLGNAKAFIRTFDVPYPSLHDTGSLMLAFYRVVPVTSLPSTIVLDTRGRVAAVVLGEVTTTMLVDLVKDVQTG